MSDPVSIFLASMGALVWFMVLLMPFLSRAFRHNGYKPVDHEANQTEADTLWAPVKVRAK